MGFLSNRVDMSAIKAGDHIYTYRAMFAYSHHGNKVVHFTHFKPDDETSSSTNTPSGSYNEMSKIPSSCSTYPDCGFRQPTSGVVLSCLDCFLKNGTLYIYEYSVNPTVFLAKIRGDTCTTATYDELELSVRRTSFIYEYNIAKERRSSGMGFLSIRVDRSAIKAGDHIYSYRDVFAYSHNGIYVGGNKVVHFTHFKPDDETSSSTNTPFGSYDEMSKIPSSCSTYTDCGFRQPKSGVVLSCLDCFLKNGTLYSFEYGVNTTIFLAKIRGGTCTTATSDGLDTVIHRAMYLLQSGFGNYDVFQNNCEDFALYCKTGILTVEKLGIGRSGQASSLIGAPLATLLTSPLKLLIPSLVGVAIVTAGMYCMSKYATHIGVKTDVVKVHVEDLVVNLAWMDGLKEAFQRNEASGSYNNS